MQLDSQTAAHQPAGDATVSPARTASPNPAWNSSPIVEPNARPDMDATYSPLRSSITGMFSKHTESGTKLDAYSYDLQPTGPLQDVSSNAFANACVNILLRILSAVLFGL